MMVKEQTLDQGSVEKNIAQPVQADVDAHLHERRRTRRIIRTTLWLLIVLGLIRVFVFEPYAIPTGSMRPTIIEGDVLLVNKLPYVIRTLRSIPFTDIALPQLAMPGFGSLERGDVVVFDFPDESEDPRGSGEEFVKRAAAIAGDTVQLIAGRVAINGAEVVPIEPGTTVAHRSVPINPKRAFALLRYGGRVVVPFEGYTVTLDSVSASRWARLIRGEGSTIEYRNRIVFIDGLPATYFTFRRDYFLALGDNSGDSHDSRFFGFVPVDNLIGQAVMVYWSRSPDAGMQWARIGTFVR